jgi:hypothetical protein
MNVALPALIAFFILLPGFIFRTNLKRAECTSLDFSPFGQIVAEAILWALVLHLIWPWLSLIVFGHQFEPIVSMRPGLQLWLSNIFKGTHKVRPSVTE